MTEGTAQSDLIRVLLVAPANATGGQAQAARDIVRGFQGHSRFQVTIQPIDPKLSGRWRALTDLPVVRTLIRPFIYLPRLRRRIREADVVQVFCTAHFAFLLGALPAILLARWMGRAVLLHYHDGRAASHLKWWGPLARWGLRQGTLVVPSPYLQGVFGRVGLQARVVPNVVDVEAFAYADPLPLRHRLISTRALEPLYAVENTLAAFRVLCREFTGLTLDIYGGGRSRAGLERLARRWGLRGVTFHGTMSHVSMPGILRAGGVMVNSSRVDNVPHFVIEAFAAGTPVVSTRAGGIPLMVESDQTGLLVALDAPAELAEAVARLLRDPALALRLARSARLECPKYSWSAAQPRWEQLYRDATRAASA